MIFGKPPDHLIKVATLIKDFWKLWAWGWGGNQGHGTIYKLYKYIYAPCMEYLPATLGHFGGKCR